MRENTRGEAMVCEKQVSMRKHLPIVEEQPVRVVLARRSHTARTCAIDASVGSAYRGYISNVRFQSSPPGRRQDIARGCFLLIIPECLGYRWQRVQSISF